MIFPVYFHVGALRIPAHEVMEAAGYLVGAQLFLALRNKFPSGRLDAERGMAIIAGCLVGALAGSKILALVESIRAYWPHRNHLGVLLSGKTIVGGLAGGWAGVEIAKHIIGVRQNTGDRFVFPILLGLAIGRVGCFLEGLPDHTYGVATALPWGVDFGDGIRRHPTQLYEIAFCLLLALALRIRMRWAFRSGEIFRLMMIGYFSWRFLIEFIKPRETYLGLSPIQIVSFATLCLALRSLSNIRKGLPIETPNLMQARLTHG
ncbi:MAG TPA: prolipoprotein diacylglyceryl transferase family protein [Tepidisphaeraceae bacterium]|nr:prolipoprotein diacylglyceryl transferase family protein [Tepidisphaeraceae bacterium]